MKITLKINLQLPSQNELPHNHFAYNRLCHRWYLAGFEAIKKQVKPSTLKHFTRHLGDSSVKYRIAITAHLFRLYDHDNLFVKFAVDLLKGVSVPVDEKKGAFRITVPQIIADDSPKHILGTIEKHQEKINRIGVNGKGKPIKNQPYTIIEVELIEAQGEAV